MSKRTEIAARAMVLNSGKTMSAEEQAHYILRAADAVMFSDEAVERAAEAAYHFDGGDDWTSFGEKSRERGRQRVRAVIAALRDAAEGK